MPSPLRPLSTIAELDVALAASSTRPILIFKHSSTCGTSAMAFEEVEELVSGGAGAPPAADIYVVHIQSARAVSNEVERRLHVRHESPQALLIHDGTVVWSATHFRVTAAAILAAINAAAAAPTSI